jgi:predicted metal-dependent phosphoesterase TrpH
MSAEFVDLHCHSIASDGTLPPAQVVRLAKESGLSAIALTDHDTVAGIAEASTEAKKIGIDFLPGIEISAEYPHPGTLHILGFGIDPNSDVLKNLTSTLIAGRDNRNPKIVAKLNAMNVAVSMEEWEAEAKGDVLGRPQLAAILVRKGYASSMKQAFEKFLGQGAPAYFDKERLAPPRAMQLIRECGGLPVLAHATQLRAGNFAQLENEIKNLVDQGLAGVEVIHSDFDQLTVNFLTDLADRLKLVKTGGSDFHGSNKPNIELGLANGRRVPRAFFDQLVDRLHKLKKAG